MALTFTVSTSIRDPLVAFLRSKNVDVSTWYPPLFYFAEIDLHVYKNFKAESFSSRVVNLWLDNQTNEIKQSIHPLIREFLTLEHANRSVY